MELTELADEQRRAIEDIERGLDEMMALLRRLVDEFEQSGHDLTCSYCSCYMGVQPNDKLHDDNCAWLIARQVVRRIEAWGL